MTEGEVRSLAPHGNQPCHFPPHYEVAGSCLCPQYADLWKQGLNHSAPALLNSETCSGKRRTTRSNLSCVSIVTKVHHLTHRSSLRSFNLPGINVLLCEFNLIIHTLKRNIGMPYMHLSCHLHADCLISFYDHIITKYIRWLHHCGHDTYLVFWYLLNFCTFLILLLSAGMFQRDPTKKTMHLAERIVMTILTLPLRSQPIVSVLPILPSCTKRVLQKGNQGASEFLVRPLLESTQSQLPLQLSVLLASKKLSASQIQ